MLNMINLCKSNNTLMICNHLVGNIVSLVRLFSFQMFVFGYIKINITIYLGYFQCIKDPKDVHNHSKKVTQMFSQAS